ncbi:hypothetical protein SNE40_008841 [Patella caerulea]|uniref:Carbohydrate sulfotransferase n=1 Tax=Patella caerulea TaxID=87958 RepID=A0AAN8JQX3_PATCE
MLRRVNFAEARNERRVIHGSKNSKMIRSVVTCAKILLFLLNLWVLSIVLVVVLGKWQIFETRGMSQPYDTSHLIVMRELKEDGDRKLTGPSATKSNPPPPEISNVAVKQKVDKGLHFAPSLTEEEDRINTMRHWCQKLRPNLPTADLIPSVKLQQILVDDKHKLLYCQIPGVAQNDWRKILVFLSGAAKVKSHLDISVSDVHSKYSKQLKRLSDFSAPERKKRIDKYYKISFVRDPLERLYSSYDNKFKAKWSTYFHLSFGKKIIQKYRKKPSKASLQKGNDVTFREFVQYVIDADDNEEHLNEHWEQFYKQCHPCLIPYDFVGKYESLNKDIDHVLKAIKVRGNIKGSLVASNYTYPKQTLTAAYKTVPLNNLHKLWKMYYPDYNLYSYPFPSLLKQLIKTKDYTDY